MQETALAPLAIYFGVVLALVALVLAASYVLGERHRERATGEPFESGIVPVQAARYRLRAKFYIVAMLFVIFDLEAVYIVSWALISREGGWAAYIEIAVFVGLLLAGLAYLWRLGALEWGTESRQRVTALHRGSRIVGTRREPAAGSRRAASGEMR